MPHPINWYAGWSLLLAAFATGALLGLGFAREKFMGGYDSWPRRLTRLGHIALAALGILNMILGIAPLPTPHTWQSNTASAALIVGSISMPLICFLSAWKKPLRHLFPIPVIALITAAICVLFG